MKIKCKCGKTLTKDLYLSKNYTYEIQNDGGWIDAKFKTGVFHISKAQPTWRNKYSSLLPAQLVKSTPEFLMVSKKDLLIEYPVMESGYGCCDWDGHELNCSCGNLLGYMYFDCWQLESMDFISKNVVRSYR